jgi:phosphoglycerate dehydrogenase-like enzyme
MTLRIAVSGIPRGFQSPRPDGNWLTEKHTNKIREVSPQIELIELPLNEIKNTKGKIKGIEILLVEGGSRIPYPGEVDWENYKKFFTQSLKWVQLCSTGFSSNITTEIRDRKVILTNAPGIHTIPIAESVVAAMLEHAKRLKQRRIYQKKRLWRQLKADELFNETVLIIGLGNIGRRIAKLCKAFDMNVIGTKKNLEQVEYVDMVFPSGNIRDHLPEADYIVVAAPITSETLNMLSEPEFKVMADKAYLINIGRGEIIHEPSLVKALKNRWIAGAYIDCFTVEPLPEHHELWGMDNVFIVPHDSHSSPHVGDRIINIFVNNLSRYVKGKSLKHVCDPEKGY